MDYKKEIVTKDKVKFECAAEGADWQSALEKAYNKMKGRFNVPGFRKGHAPRKKVEAIYGAGVFFEDALDIILPEYYEKVLDAEKDLTPAARPDVDIVAISDAEVKFAFTVQLVPEVKLGQYTGLEIKKEKVKVTDAEIDAEIKAAQEKAGSFEPVTDRAAENGDKATIDFSGSVDGVKFEGGTAEKYDLTLGSGMFIPGFEEQVCGMKIGDEKDVVVKFPEDYGEGKLAGKEAVFAVKLHELKVKNLPEVNDEFAKDVSEFNTLAEYKASIKEKLSEQKTKNADINAENELIDTIIKNAEVEVPEIMAEERAEDMVHEFEYRISYQGMKPDDYYNYTGSTREQLKETYMEQAKKNVLAQLVTGAIIKKENLNGEKPEETTEKLLAFLKEKNKFI